MDIADLLNSSSESDLPFLDFSSSSSSDETNSDDEGDFVCVNDFINTINSYSETQFKSHFRLNRDTVLFLIQEYYESDIIPSLGAGRRRIGAEKEIYLFVWYISNTISFRQLGNLFGLRKASAWRCVNRVAGWLISIGHKFIKWPKGAKVAENSQKFETMRGIAGLKTIILDHLTFTDAKSFRDFGCVRHESYNH